MYTETDASFACIPLAGMPFHRRYVIWSGEADKGRQNFCKGFSRKLTCNLKTMSYDFTNSGSTIDVLSLKSKEIDQLYRGE